MIYDRNCCMILTSANWHFRGRVAQWNSIVILAKNGKRRIFKIIAIWRIEMARISYDAQICRIVIYKQKVNVCKMNICYKHFKDLKGIAIFSVRVVGRLVGLLFSVVGTSDLWFAAGHTLISSLDILNSIACKPVLWSIRSIFEKKWLFSFSQINRAFKTKLSPSREVSSVKLVKH